MRVQTGLAVVVAAGFVLAACSGGGDDGTGLTPAFTMSVSPSSLALDIPSGFVAGGEGSASAALVEAAATSGNLTVTITRTGGFTGAVNIAVEGLPTGVTANTATIAAGATSTSLTISAGATASAGSQNFTVRGTGTGVTARTANVGLTVNAPPSIGIALQPSTVSVGQGGTGNTNLNITRNGSFTGAVNLTSSGAPAGMTVAFNPASATGASSAITITVGGAVPTGNHQVTITATGAGVANVTTVLTVTVTAPVPAISLSLNPSTVPVQQGQSGTSALTIARTNFTGAVTLAATGAPAGMTVSFNPSNTTTSASTVTIDVGGAVATGNHQVTINATGTGVTQASTILTVSVTAVQGIVTLSLSPVALSIDQGASMDAAMTINRTNFAGTLNLTATGAPAGMTVGFNPASTTTNASTITVTVGGAVGAGIYPITIRGNGTGLTEATAILTVTVTIPGGTPTIVLNLLPTGLSIQQGANDNSALTITRTNFTGTVNLTATGAPAGMTVAFNPASTTGNTSTITVTVGGAVATGNHQITIRGNGTGLTEATTILTVTVTAPGGGGSVVMTFCAQSGVPLWLAAQTFGGAWTQVTPVGNVYSFNITTKGAVAWVTQNGGQTSLTLIYGTVADLNQRGGSQCGGTGATKTVNGTAAGLTATDLGTFAMGGGSTTLFATGGPFQLTGVRDGLQDLLATRTSFVTGFVNKVFISRGLNPVDGGSVGTVDFATALDPVGRTATVLNLGADQAAFSSLFNTSNGTGANISAFAPISGSNTLGWLGVPDVNTVAGDWHMQSVIATPSGNMTGFPFRSVTQFNRFSADRTYTLPAYINTPPTVQVTGTAPYVTINSSWTVQGADFDDFWMLNYNPNSGTVSSVSIMGSAGYFGGGPVTLDLPNFGAGFNAAWGLQPGIQTQWTFLANGGSAWSVGTGTQAFEGAVSTVAAVTGTITP